MSNSVRYTRGIAWMTIGNWSEQTLNLVVFVVLIRLLGAEAFGVLTMAMALVLVGEGLVRETVSEYVFSAGRVSEALIDSLFWVLLLLGGGITALLFLTAPAAADMYDTPLVRELLWALAPIVVLTAVTAVPVALLRHRMEIRPLAARAFFGVLFGGVVGIGLALAGAGVWALVAQRIVLTLVNVVIAWKAADWWPGRWRGLGAMRDVLPFGTGMLFYRAAEIGTVQLPAVVIGMALGPVKLGYYAIAWRLVELGAFLIVTPVRTAALPAFAAERYAPGKGRILFSDTLRLTGFLCIPAFTGLAVVAPDLLAAMGGSSWTPAAPALTVLSAFGAIFCLAKVEETYALAHGRARELAWVASINLVLGLVLMIALSGLGLAAMVAAIVISALCLVPVRLALISRINGQPIFKFFRQQAGPVIASLAMAAVLLLVRPLLDPLPAAVAVALSTMLGATVYMAIAVLKMKRRLSMARGYLEGLRVGGLPVSPQMHRETQ